MKLLFSSRVFFFTKMKMKFKFLFEEVSKENISAAHFGFAIFSTFFELLTEKSFFDALRCST